MSLSEIKISSAATPREMALAKIKEADKLINEAGGQSCISEGLSILREALLWLARNNSIGNTVPSILSILRDTNLALNTGPPIRKNDHGMLHAVATQQQGTNQSQK